MRRPATEKVLLQTNPLLVTTGQCECFKKLHLQYSFASRPQKSKRQVGNTADLGLIVLIAIVFVVDLVLFAEFAWMQERARRARSPRPSSASAEDSNSEQRSGLFELEASPAHSPYAYAIQEEKEAPAISPVTESASNLTELRRELAIMRTDLNDVRSQLNESGQLPAQVVKRLDEDLAWLASRRLNDLKELDALKTDVAALRYNIRDIYGMSKKSLQKEIEQLEIQVDGMIERARKLKSTKKR